VFLYYTKYYTQHLQVPHTHCRTTGCPTFLNFFFLYFIINIITLIWLLYQIRRGECKGLNIYIYFLIYIQTIIYLISNMLT
jgi:hypothetical protein